jgi:hypothetical protein
LRLGGADPIGYLTLLPDVGLTLGMMMIPTRTQRLHLVFAALTLGFMGACNDAASSKTQPPIDSPAWMGAAMEMSVGRHLVLEHDDEAAKHTLQALGFAQVSESRYTRMADLLAPESLTPSVMPALPEIDAVAVISVYRPKLQQEQYIYPTLRSLLAELPEGGIVNVLVGNGDTAYLDDAMLIEHVGAHAPARVRVMAPPEGVAEFFAQHAIATAPKATWNFSRAMRSYRGSKHLLMLEDDVRLSANGLLHMRPYLNHAPVDVFTLFNDRCDGVRTSLRRADTELALGMVTIRKNNDFPTTQMLVISAHAANDAGEYLVTRAGRESYDYMLGRFFAMTRSKLAYVKPSIAQHTGFETTGLSGPGVLPMSGCFAEALGDITPSSPLLVQAMPLVISCTPAGCR